jgi:hypothetical protein
MSIVDERGRLFGRFNLIDASVVAVVVLLLPIAFAAYLLFRPAPMRITSVEPRQVPSGPGTRVRLTGEHFRPYLRAEVGRVQPNRFLIESPTAGEIVMPPLEPGTYDITLYDEAEEVARMKGAITVGAASRPALINMQLLGMFTNLDDATARTVTAGRRFPDHGDALVEVISAAAPIEDIRRVRTTTQVVEVPVKGSWRVPATVRVGCEFNFEKQSCDVNGATIIPGLVLPIAGGVRFLVDEVHADTAGVPMEVVVRFVGRQEVLDALKMGDADKLAFNGSGARAARIVSITSRQSVAGETLMRLLPGQQPVEMTSQLPDRFAVVEAIIHLIAEPGADSPTYRSSVIKPGSVFTFDSPSYVAQGTIVRSAPLRK